MSRSKCNTPIFGFAICRSERECKKIWHSRMRAKERDRLAVCYESETTIERDVSNPWRMRKDGKYWRYDAQLADMRK